MPDKLAMGVEDVPMRVGSGYPAPHDKPCQQRARRRLGDQFGLTQFGANQLELPPGAWSSQRHWHEGEDELVVMIEGEAMLVEDEGETVMRPGDIAAFPKGVANGHHLVNRSARPCVFVAIGKPSATDCHYPDIDMHLDAASGTFTRKDGSSY